MDAASPCENCLAHPKPIRVPSNAFPGALPASVAWLRSQDPKEFMQILRNARAAMAAKDLAALKGLESQVGGDAAPGNARAFLSTVILALAARGRIRLFDISHKTGFASRLFGKSEAAGVHVAAAGADRDGEGVVEQKVLAGVRNGTGPKTPHGPRLRKVVESVFKASVTSPGSEILNAAKEDAIGRGIGRWIPKEEIPPLADGGSGGMVEGLVEGLFERAIRGARFYEILRPRESTMASELAALEAMRKDVAAADISRLEEEIQSGLDARTYVPE
jgi:hypothetical protein